MNTLTSSRYPSVLLTGLRNIAQDSFLSIGLLLIFVSATLFSFTSYQPMGGDSHLPFFFIHYAFSGGYLLALLLRGIFVLRWNFLKESVRYYIPYLVLSLISAYALNRAIPVFDTSTPWLCVFLVVQCGVMLGFLLYDHLPLLAQRTLFLLLGMGFILYVYLSVYVMPMYLFSFVGLLFLGMSIHTYVPLFWVVSALLLLGKYYSKDKTLLYIFLAGAALAISIVTVHVVYWIKLDQVVVKEYSQSIMNEDELPAWVRVSQQLPQNSLSEKLLKKGIVYTVFDQEGNWFWRMPRNSFEEARKHDPLVVISNLFSSYTALDDKEKIKILETLYDSRHQAQERLWSGEHLQTRQVISQVQLWPEYRMAYTEKIITVGNQAQNRWSTEEGLYTFHLPEGSVITSLSLWINGIEEKGYLTTKQKADTAYRTIVGVESRDPSLVHWQEGNTVTVRVFPVNAGESRRFKLGITSPLQLQGNELVYQNIYFDGPLHENSEEIRKIITNGALLLPLADYSQTPEGNYAYSGHYQPAWQLKVPAVPLASSTFSFLNKSYRLKAYEESLEPVRFESIYLDLNAAWTQKEVRSVMQLCKNAKVYAWHNNSLIKLTPANFTNIHAHCATLNFSLFPLYAIKDKHNSLLISKGTPTSPNLSDIKSSIFYEKSVKAFEKSEAAQKTFFLETEELSPYLKTLKEFRLVHSDHGSLERLELLLEKNLFPAVAENEQQLLIAPANMLIVEEEGTAAAPTQAPDHLYRLFAYNAILRKAGPQAIQKDFTDPGLVAAAEQAYVVSPVSSLIVLETKKDYERFGIEQSKNSLQNATMKSTGAAPEPHEWALIIVVALAVLVFMFPTQLKNAWPF